MTDEPREDAVQKITTWLWFDTEAEVECDSQDEVDRYWARLADGGEEVACGWVTDRYVVAWQITPRRLHELLADPDREQAQRVMEAMLKMTKIEIAELDRAAAAV